MNKEMTNSIRTMGENDELWYAAYGSNLSEERFRWYILGGYYIDHEHKGCRDKRLWRASEVTTVPGHMYFAQSSSRWNGGGVAFFDPDGEGEAVVRLYRITAGQLRDIREQEGPSESWYGHVPCLCEYKGLPVCTLTSLKKHPSNAPDPSYLDLIREALVGECSLTEEEAEAYLRGCLG